MVSSVAVLFNDLVSRFGDRVTVIDTVNLRGFHVMVDIDGFAIDIKSCGYCSNECDVSIIDLNITDDYRFRATEPVKWYNDSMVHMVDTLIKNRY